MRRPFALLLELAVIAGVGVSLVGCRAHVHGLAPDTQVVTIRLTSGLS